MADDVVGLDPALADRSEDRERGCDEGGLLHGRVEQLLLLAVEAQALEVEAGGAAPALEDGHGRRDGLGDVPAHAGLRRALTREAKRDLAQVAPAPFISAVQRINAEPQVSPAPIPVIRTSFPGLRRPSAAASASASGMEPEEVLP